MKLFLILQLYLSFSSGSILQEKPGGNNHVVFDLKIPEPELRKAKGMHPCKYTGGTHDISEQLRQGKRISQVIHSH